MVYMMIAIGCIQFFYTNRFLPSLAEGLYLYLRLHLYLLQPHKLINLRRDISVQSSGAVILVGSSSVRGI
jgi:hypothetical protein